MTDRVFMKNSDTHMFFISRVDKIIYISLAVSYISLSLQCTTYKFGPAFLGQYKTVISKNIKYYETKLYIASFINLITKTWGI